MNMQEQIEQILGSDPNDNTAFVVEVCISNSYVNDPDRFSPEEFLQIVRDFVSVTDAEFDLTDYLTERLSIEKVFRTVMRKHHLPEDLLEDATREAITAYFEACIDEQIAIYKTEDPGAAEPQLPEDDLGVVTMADILAHVPCSAEDEAFCESIGVDYHFEQLHMIRWFAGQITLNRGKYARQKPNFSARVTYNRLLNADSLLWIGTVVGVDRGSLKRAADEIGDERRGKNACAAVRQAVPFEEIHRKATALLEQFEAECGVPEEADGEAPAPPAKAAEAAVPAVGGSPGSVGGRTPVAPDIPVIAGPDPETAFPGPIQTSDSTEYDGGASTMPDIDKSTREEIKGKLREHFAGRIVRKDLTKKIKEGANVPVYVLEFLLGQYCSSDDEEIIEQGVQNVKRILADNFVRPDEAQKTLSLLRQRGSYTIIDMVTVALDIRHDAYVATFSNLGLSGLPISEEYPEKYDRLLCGGIWCIVQLEYEFNEQDTHGSPVRIRKLTPIQMPHVDIDELKAGRSAFTKEEWMDVLLRSIGMEPDELTVREKWLLLIRMIPLVENNYNLCELGPRSTGKSHLYKEISPNSILVSGGQTTVANLFYNMARKQVGLVGLWDCVAFDEVAGIKFKDKDGVQIMKDYMASGSFARGKEEKAASASMVFVGNINQSVDVLLKTSSLFDPFPPEMGTDTAFLDRIHCYLPGWEIPKFRPEHFTDDYGFITDYLAEFVRELRKEQYGDALDRWYHLGKNLNQRDVIAVRRTVDGLLKLIYPHGDFSKEELEEILQIALEMRRRVKEQLKKLGGMEFYDVNFSYVDNETFEEHYVTVPEQGGGKLIPDGLCNPGQVYTVSRGKSGMIGVFRLESQMLPGNGKFDRTGIGADRAARESSSTAFNFLKANGNRISGSISTTTKDYIINYQDLQGIGMTGRLALPSLIALCSIALNRPTQSGLAVLGEISISGTMMKVDELANTLQCCLDSGAKKVLIPSVSMIDFATVPADLMGAFQLIPYSSAEDAVFKALGVE